MTKLYFYVFKESNNVIGNEFGVSRLKVP
jgi:hypothetical protein